MGHKSHSGRAPGPEWLRCASYSRGLRRLPPTSSLPSKRAVQCPAQGWRNAMPEFNIVSPPVCHRYGHHQLANKLDPMFFPEMTPEFAAIVGFVVNAGYTRPILCEVSLDSGFVVAAFSGTERYALFTYAFLRRNA